MHMQVTHFSLTTLLSIVSILFADEGNTLYISSDTSSPVSEGTTVQFSCTFYANPFATLSLWRSDGDTVVQVTDQIVSNTFFSLSVDMSRDYNDWEFYCRAAGQEYDIESTRIPLKVTCELPLSASKNNNCTSLHNSHSKYLCTYLYRIPQKL